MLQCCEGVSTYWPKTLQDDYCRKFPKKLRISLNQRRTRKHKQMQTHTNHRHTHTHTHTHTHLMRRSSQDSSFGEELTHWYPPGSKQTITLKIFCWDVCHGRLIICRIGVVTVACLIFRVLTPAVNNEHAVLSDNWIEDHQFSYCFQWFRKPALREISPKALADTWIFP